MCVLTDASRILWDDGMMRTDEQAVHRRDAHCVPIKTSTLYFSNNSVKNQVI